MKRTITVIFIMALILSVLLSSIPSISAGEVISDPIEEGIMPPYGVISPESCTADDIEPGLIRDEEASLAATGADIDVTEYSYTVTPLMAPFNRYFFVKTDNPNPKSFVFADHDTIYAEDGDILTAETGFVSITKFADIQYEDEGTGRVNGGYIFKSDQFDVDGGTIVLQKKVRKIVSGYIQFEWEDTDIKLTLPKLKDGVDYLIDTYGDPNKGFFDNMEAIQTGFQSICYYSGSYVRGTVEQTAPYWWLSVAGHIDQSFYIFSPYERSDNRSLFASAIYPYRYDSLGFPGMMGAIAQRLDKNATVKWNENYHWLIDVTYDGTTRSYGGEGEPEGQGVSADKILRYFTFDKNDRNMTLEESYDLLKQYTEIEMEDDIPRENELTWGFICDTVGDGAWVKLSGTNIYTYLYTNDSSNSFHDDEWGVGYKIYWSGKMGYFTDTWVDGRYIGKWRHTVRGATLADYPEASIFLKNVPFPIIKIKTSWHYDSDQQKYVGERIVDSIVVETKSVKFNYSSTDDLWKGSIPGKENTYASYDQVKQLVEEGKLDEKYLDMMSLTHDEVNALHVDRNTGSDPFQGYSFDGTTEPGTPFGFDYLIGDTDGDGAVDIVDATLLQRYLADMDTPVTEDALTARGDTDESGSIELTDVTAIQHYTVNGKIIDKIGQKQS